MGGDDTINGGDGNDFISAGDGNNSLMGGNGDDTIFAGSGNDTITGGVGNDNINSGGGIDAVNAGDGDDTIQVDTRFTSVIGGLGTDTLFLSGTLGRTINLATAGIERIQQGSEGNDTLMAAQWLCRSLSMGVVVMTISPVAVPVIS